jgi:hypothetical protein
MLFKNAADLKFNDKAIFRTRVSKQLIQSGLLIILLFYINIAKDIFANRIIKDYTNGHFIKDEKFIHWV